MVQTLNLVVLNLLMRNISREENIKIAKTSQTTPVPYVFHKKAHPISTGLCDTIFRPSAGVNPPPKRSQIS